MNKILILITILFFTSCGAAPDQSSSSGSAKQPLGEASTGQPSGVDVKVTKNGSALAAFQSKSDIGGVGAQLEKDHLSVEIMSPDNKWVFSVEVPGAKAGVYGLTSENEAGKAMIRLMGDDVMVRADAGQLKLTEVSDTYCSGSFTGTSTDMTGNKYSYEGKFSRVRVIRQD